MGEGKVVVIVLAGVFSLDDLGDLLRDRGCLFFGYTYTFL
jgi:hypothetical protein